MTANQGQHEAWNGGESVHYVDHADRYDRQLAPFTDLLIEGARLQSHHSLLDIGCGCGAATLVAAQHVQTAVGADISQPLLEIAAKRARVASVNNAEFTVADVQTHAFREGAFDVAISQFGLMFFDDPIAAFGNLRLALKPDGRIVFVCWQGLEANEWLMTLGEVVAKRAGLPNLGGQAGGPGMFALKDATEIRELLDTAGFGPAEVEPITPSIILGGGGTLDDSLNFLLGMGMARGLLGRLGPGAQEEAVAELRSSLAEIYEPGVGVRVGASALLVSAPSMPI